MIVNICEPSYYKGKIYASGLGGLKCFNIDNGDIVWKRKDIGSWNTLALSDDKLIITFDKYVEEDTYIGSVIALNVNTGKTLWYTELSGHVSSFSSASIAYNRIYVTSKSVFPKKSWKNSHIMSRLEHGKIIVEN